jgi:hypothetical protein
MVVAGLAPAMIPHHIRLPVAFANNIKLQEEPEISHLDNPYMKIYDLHEIRVSTDGGREYGDQSTFYSIYRRDALHDAFQRERFECSSSRRQLR